MNWLARLARWLEARQVIRVGQFREVLEDQKRLWEMSGSQISSNQTALQLHWEKIKGIQEQLDGLRLKVGEINKKLETPVAAEELAKLKIRMNRVELFVGLQREQAKPVGVPGEARIE